MATTPPRCGNPACPQASTTPSDSPAPLLLCSRCRKTRYCSSSCQSASWPAHKKACRRQNYIIKFHLAPEHIRDPPVVRTLSCPADAPFYALHMALQTAFGWGWTHSFDFAVADPAYAPPADLAAYVQQIMLRDQNGGQSNPASAPREYLIRIVDPVPQSVRSGIDRMHEGGRRHPRTVEKKAEDWRLWQLLEHKDYKGEQVLSYKSRAAC